MINILCPICNIGYVKQFHLDLYREYFDVFIDCENCGKLYVEYKYWSLLQKQVILNKQDNSP